MSSCTKSGRSSFEFWYGIKQKQKKTSGNKFCGKKTFFSENNSISLLTNNIFIPSWNQKWKYDCSQHLYCKDKQNNPYFGLFELCNTEFVLCFIT